MTPPRPAGRSSRLAAFGRANRGFVSIVVLLVALSAAADAWLLQARSRYERDIAAMRQRMDAFERDRSDLLLTARARQARIAMDSLRRLAEGDREIHLSVSVDSGRMYLERQGALLRRSAVDVGPARRIGVPPDTVQLAVPRGTRTVTAVLGPKDLWTVPAWVYRDRGLPVPADRALAGALGSVAVILDGGTVIYTLPSSGPLADPAYVLPGSIRAGAEDLNAVAPNLARGSTVYFY